MKKAGETISGFFRIVKLLFSNRSELQLFKVLPRFIGNFKSYPPDQFLKTMLVWCKNLAAVQGKYYYSTLKRPLADDEYLAEWNFALRRELIKESVEINYRPRITLITTFYGHNLEMVRHTFQSVLSQVYANWEYYILLDLASPLLTNGSLESIVARDERFIVKTSANLAVNLAKVLNETLENCQGEAVVFLHEGDQLTGEALEEIVSLLNQHRDAAVIYSDAAQVRDNVLVEILYKPGWSPDLLHCCNYLGNLLWAHKETIRAVGGFHGVFEDDIKYDLILRLAEKGNRIYHLPRILYYEQVPRSSYPPDYNFHYASELQKKVLQHHLERLDLNAEVCDGIFQGSFRVRRQISGQPRISILIPTRDKAELLKRCIDSIEAKTTYKNYEIVVIDNGSSEPESLEYLDRVTHPVIQYPGEFNFSRINNFAAEHASGEYLLFLNNDTEVISPEWLEAMLEHAQREEVGAVGARLVYPDGSVQHAGMILVKNRWPDHAHRLTPFYDHGLYGMVDVIRNYNMVTAACMMTAKKVFEQVGGFDEKLAVVFNDIDFCFRVRSSGFLIVYTPYATLYHYEGISRWSDKQSNRQDETLFFSRWKIME
jgi:GT2 family glycosyltransferase